MKSLDNMPSRKISRAAKLVGAGAKVGVNYLKYYGERLSNPEEARKHLDESNAEDLYDSLSQLKGSALKMAQMLSMEKSVLPKAYQDKFSLAQFNVPPLSPQLVRASFKKYMGKYPEDIFDTFSPEAIHAASIGQVHKATIGEKVFAVKIQYPGVQQSISSDLAMVKPIAMRMFQLNAKEHEKFFQEMESKLLEETDYRQELAQGEEWREICDEMEGLVMPRYYKEYSSDKILTMDWMHGRHLGEILQDEEPTEPVQKIGQRLWDFYMIQIFQLQKLHADPHPGNFLADQEGNLTVLDLGCVKRLPDSFAIPYRESALRGVKDKEIFEQGLWDLEILQESDDDETRKAVRAFFGEMLSLFTSPFRHAEFDFADPTFWNSINALSERLQHDKELKILTSSRGSKHFLYVNRTFFGLYNMLFDMKAKIVVDRRGVLPYPEYRT